MPDLEVTIFNQKIKLSYQHNEKERLINAVNILNHNWKKFSSKLLLVQNKDDKYELSIEESQNWIKIIESLK